MTPRLSQPILRILFCPIIASGILSSIDAEEPKLTYEQHVRPILKAHCFHCHGESGVKEGNLDLRLKRFIVAGGDSGNALTAHNSAESLLVERIEAGEMPPEDKSLPADDLALIKKWIDQGAPTVRKEPTTISDTHLTEEEKSFWSFQPINLPSIPEVKESSRVRNPIDSFVLSELEQRGLSFSNDASRTTLIRRLYFDLTGLPPSPDEVTRFLSDHSRGAIEKLVDRLLASPRYGERWGRHWLDVAGYADSEGYTDKDPERPFAFFYRDYVIKSFNAGKPFDQFIHEQLAGDELLTSPLEQLSEMDRDRLIATGFLRMAPDGTASGGVDRAVAANETISDTINIVSTSLLGLTVGCARCHNHRYDPISQVDYYRMRAIFEPALDWKAWKNPRQRQISLYTEAERKTRGEIEKRAKAVEELRQKKQAAHIERTLYEELLVAPDEKRDDLRVAYKTEKSKRSKEQIKLLEEFPNIQNISNGSLYLYAEQRGRRANGIQQEGIKRANRLINKIRSQHLEKLPAKERTQLEKIIALPIEKRSTEQQALAEQHPQVFVTQKNLEKFDPQGANRVGEYLEAAEKCRQIDAKTELANLAKEAAQIRSQAPREFFVRALVEPKNHVPATKLFRRGNHLQPSQIVQPGELEILSQTSLPKIPENDKSRDTTGRRLAYARLLTSGNHPLVARVIVNRIWLHHFGKGLVETTGDFGFLGAPPTHPKLLDWLAIELMASGWNLKHLQRLIVTSATYQQASTKTEQLEQKDPDNRWYARQSIRRLESESIRDAILQVSGMLVNKMNGPAVPVKEDAVGQIVLGMQKLDGERKPQPGNKLGEDAERRSLYIQVRRTRPLAVLESFDVASNSPNCTQRNYSNVAPQSLMLMNSEFMVRYAAKMAEKLAREFEERDEQVDAAFKLCFSRSPEPGDLQSFRKFLVQQSEAFQTANSKLTDQVADQLALANLCHAFLSSNEFFYID